MQSEHLKNKKHYNSFHPKLGFFIHLDDILDWFEAVPSVWRKVRRRYIPLSCVPS